MDLRIVKTKRLIKETFLKLRAENPLEKIQVTELCREAQINKTTFYNHYKDIFVLSDELENETIEQILAECKFLDSLYTDPNKFIGSLLGSFKQSQDVLMLLFTGRMNILIDKVEQLLKTTYLSPGNTMEEDILLSFLIGGATHVWLNPEYDEDTINRTVSGIILSICKSW